MNRDTQRDRVYRAEGMAWSALRKEQPNALVLDRNHRTELQDAQWYVRRVSDWKEFRRWTPRIERAVASRDIYRHRIVVQMKRNGSSHSDGGVDWVNVTSRGVTHHRPRIRMTDFDLTHKGVLLHECAHWVGTWDELGHGPKFAWALAQLADKFICERAGELLRAAYAECGVDAYWS